jgi:RNA polymerase sigma-70 factor (ECF subfamily)
MSSTINTDPWIERLRGPQPGRDAAINELREIIVRGLRRSLSQRYGGAVQADDVAQEAVLKILDSLDRFDGRSRFTTWAMTIATRIGISELRRKHYQNVSLDDVTPTDSLSIESNNEFTTTPEAQLDRDALLMKLGELIDKTLSDRQKLAIRGLLEGLPVEEVARRIDSNRNAVYKLIHDARLKLRAGLEAAGFDGADIGELFT